LASSFAVSASAADDTALSIDLIWNAPPGCPTSTDVLEVVRRRLADRGRAPASVVTARADVAAGVKGAPWRLTLSVSDDQGEGARFLEASSCAELADATALILAMSLRSEGLGSPGAANAPSGRRAESRPGILPSGRLAREELAEWQLAASSLPPPQVDLPLPKKSAPKNERSRGVGLWIGAAVQNDVGTLPLPSAGAVGLIGVRVLDVVRLEVAGSYWAEQRIEQARFSLATAAVSACPTRRLLDELEFAVCGAAELGRWHVEAAETSDHDERETLWVALRTGAALTWFGTEWGGVFARTDVSVPLVHPSSEVTEYGHSERPELAAARGLLGLEVRVR
jgi:hypothetical protein